MKKSLHGHILKYLFSATPALFIARISPLGHSSQLMIIRLAWRSWRGNQQNAINRSHQINLYLGVKWIRYVAWPKSSWAEICVKFCDIITERESGTAKMTPRFDPHMLRLLRQLPTCFSEIQNTTSFSNHKKIIKNTSRSSEMPNTTISLINKKPSRIPCHSKK